MDSNSTGPSVDDSGLLRLSLWTPETSRRCVPDGKYPAFFLLRFRSRRCRSECWHWQRASRTRRKCFVGVAPSQAVIEREHILPRVCCSESTWSQSGHLVFVSLTRTHEPPILRRERQLDAKSVKFLRAARRTMPLVGSCRHAPRKTIPAS